METPTGIKATAPATCGAGAIESLTHFAATCPSTSSQSSRLRAIFCPNPTQEQRVATAFHRNHRSNAEGGIVPEEFRVEYVADRAETTSTVWLGLTMGCARCHDHKYDPIKQKEFYRLFAFFNMSPRKVRSITSGTKSRTSKAPTAEQQAELKEWDGKVAQSERRWEGLQPTIAKNQAEWEKAAAKGGRADWTLPDGLVFRGVEGTATGCVRVHPTATCRLWKNPPGRARQFDGKRFLETPGEPANFDYLEP